MWSAWTPAQRDRLGVHPRFGEITVGASMERFIVDHLADHATQLETTLGIRPAGD
jgi:hypothetical protein